MSKSEPAASIEVALAHTARLLRSAPELAARQADEILKVAPGHVPATLLLGIAHRAQGNLDESVKILRALAAAHPENAAAHYELGAALSAAGQARQAVEALRRSLDIQPEASEAWRMLADQLTGLGDLAAADAAYAQSIRSSIRDPRLLRAGAALCENRIPEAEALLRAHLKTAPTDVAAIRMFAEVAARLRRYGDAETLLERCLTLAPSFNAARHNYAVVLHRQNKLEAALRETEKLLAAEPRHPSFNNLKAAILAKIGEMEDAIRLYSAVLETYPNQPKVWLSYGHALKTAGRESDSVTAYRRCIALAPNFGEAYWSLANLKTWKFEPQEAAAMLAQLERADLSVDDRLHLHFAAGKALEDAGEYAAAFSHYSEGNRLRRGQIFYDAAETTGRVRRQERLFTRAFFSERAGFGTPAPDPIFIVGLPRSGSTLIEQILASHGQVEGTMELPDVAALARELYLRQRRADESAYEEVLARATAEECTALGCEYLRRTRIQRKTSAAFFIDKMPNNFLHLGLIHLSLPRAKIIDARRHPIACGFSMFKQHFARGQHFTYSLDEIAAYYRDYVDLMAHYDEVLPGRVHRVIYEKLVDDTEGEVRRLLEYCALPFDDRCLRFFENQRAVRTASSQQVRQPVFRQGLDQWRRFGPQLAGLTEKLADLLERDQYQK